VGEPAAGRVIAHAMRPGIADAARSGRERLDAIARWLQDVAYLDLVDAGFEGRGAWAVRRLRIRVERFPRFGDDLRLRTFCTGIGRFSAERRTSVAADGESLVETVALWICLDAESLRPMRFPPDFVEVYAESAAGRDANVRLRHPEPPEGTEREPWSFRTTDIDAAEREPWSFRTTDIDAAGHVNNSHFWAVLDEELAGVESETIDAEVEHREPAQAGEAVVLRDGAMAWVASPGGELHASIMRPSR
jgi:acyl-ACP thioesterase